MAMQLPQTLTLEVAGTALQAMRAGAGGDTGAIDASALQIFDTAALAVLLQAMRQAQAQGQPFSVQGAPPKLVQLAQLYGVAELLGLTPAP